MVSALKTRYVTDSFSTLGGLASVAYGDPEYFREVQNQVYAQSPTRFLDMHRPSAVVADFFGSSERVVREIMTALESRYQTDSVFSDYIDIEFGADWRDVLEDRISVEFFLVVDAQESYNLTMSDYLGVTFSNVLPLFPDVRSLSAGVLERLQNLADVGEDVQLISRVASNNPQTKLSVPPLDSRVDLEGSVDLGSDYRGVEFTLGYITPQEYWKDVAYPGLTSAVIPTALRDSINQGYVGYSSQTPLEALFNPVGAQSVSSTDLPVESTSPTNSPASYLSQFPEQLQADKDVYSISLMGETLNGYTTFDPATMSNGDLIDQSQVPQFEEENADPLGGLTSSSRNFTTAF